MPLAVPSSDSDSDSLAGRLNPIPKLIRNFNLIPKEKIIVRSV